VTAGSWSPIHPVIRSRPNGL